MYHRTAQSFVDSCCNCVAYWADKSMVDWSEIGCAAASMQEAGGNNSSALSSPPVTATSSRGSIPAVAHLTLDAISEPDASRMRPPAEIGNFLAPRMVDPDDIE